MGRWVTEQQIQALRRGLTLSQPLRSSNPSPTGAVGGQDVLKLPVEKSALPKKF